MPMAIDSLVVRFILNAIAGFSKTQRDEDLFKKQRGEQTAKALLEQAAKTGKRGIVIR